MAALNASSQLSFETLVKNVKFGRNCNKIIFKWQIKQILHLSRVLPIIAKNMLHQKHFFNVTTVLYGLP